MKWNNEERLLKMSDLTLHNSNVTVDWKSQHKNGTDSDEQHGIIKFSDPNVYRNYETDWMYDDYNHFRVEIHEEFLNSIHQQTSVFAVFLSVWSLVINTIVILACFRNKESRMCGFYCNIVNFSVSNIVISVFVLPLTIYHIQREWNLGQTVCKIYVISDVMLPFISITIIIIINIERIMSVAHPNLHSWIFLKTFKTVTVCVPWVIALIIVIPLWTSGTIPYDNGSNELYENRPEEPRNDKPLEKLFEKRQKDQNKNKHSDPYENRPGECIVLISKESAILCPLITYFIPLVCIIAFTFRLLLLRIQLSTTINPEPIENTRMSLKNYQCQQNNTECESECSTMSRPVPSTSTMQTKKKKDDIVALCIVNMLFTAMWFPFQCISFLLAFCQSSTCVPSYGLNQVVTWIGASTAGVVPLLWFIDSQLRSALRIKFPQRLDESGDSTHSEETFL